MRWQVTLTLQARARLEAVQDRRLREQIRDRIDGLGEEPEKQGKALVGELAGYRSLRVAGQRYRIIYRVEHERVIILVVALGIRREGSRADVYALARKVLRLRLLEAPAEYAAEKNETTS